jgi:hypothetical protein
MPLCILTLCILTLCILTLCILTQEGSLPSPTTAYAFLHPDAGRIPTFAHHCLCLSAS